MHVSGMFHAVVRRAPCPFLRQSSLNIIMYGKIKKRSLKPLEELDPRPIEYRGTANIRLNNLLEHIRGKGLVISLSVDPKVKVWKDIDTDMDGPRLPSTAELQECCCF